VIKKEAVANWTPEVGYKNVLDRGFKPVIYLSVGSTLITFISPFLPFMIVLVMLCNILIPIWHVILLRQEFTFPAGKILNPSRKFIVRWLSRLAFSSLVIPFYVTSIGWAIISCPIGFYGYTYLQYRYLKWQVHRAQNEIPLHTIEKLVLYGLFIALLVAFLFMSFFMYQAGIGIEDILQTLPSIQQKLLGLPWFFQCVLGTLLILLGLTLFVFLMIEPISTLICAFGMAFICIFLIGLF